LEDDTATKKPAVPAVVAEVVTSAPIVADKPLASIVPEPVKEEVVLSESPVVENNEIIPVEVVNDEKVAEAITEVEITPTSSPVVETANEVSAVVESDSPATPEAVLSVVSQTPLADQAASVSTPTKATSEEEGLLEGIINTLTFDDEGEDGKNKLK
jgi:hypothetical protein